MIRNRYLAFILVAPIILVAVLVLSRIAFDLVKMRTIKITQPCRSIQEAARRQTLVSRAFGQPKTLDVLGRKVSVKEIWVENASEIDRNLIWIPYVKECGYRYLCLTLDAGEDLFGNTGLLFITDDRSGFARAGTDNPVFFLRLQGRVPTSVFVSSDWKSPPLATFSLRYDSD
jgi:hypothetical protein